MDKPLRVVPPAISIAYAVIVLALCRPGALVFLVLLSTYLWTMASVWVMVGLCALLVATICSHRAGERKAATAIARDFLESRWRSDRFGSVLVPLFSFVLLITCYNIFKALYLPSAGFWFGHPVADAEYRLLGGRDAWTITHSIFRSPWATQVLDLLYHVWFAPMVAGVAICSFTKRTSRLSWRYLCSYLLLWSIQGTVIAYFVPAAGPAMHGSIHPGCLKFAALEKLLAAQDAFLRSQGAPGLYSIDYQHALVALLGQSTVVIGGGISAMPSLHNAMAVLFACAAWSLGRRAGIAATAYAFVIWIGSIHLGWHYALDGIAACVLTILTWLAVGLVQERLDRDRRAAPDAGGPDLVFGEPGLAGDLAVA